MTLHEDAAISAPLTLPSMREDEAAEFLSAMNLVCPLAQTPVSSTWGDQSVCASRTAADVDHGSVQRWSKQDHPRRKTEYAARYGSATCPRSLSTAVS